MTSLKCTTSQDIIRCYDPKFAHQFDPEKSYIEEKSLVTMVLMSLNFLQSDSPIHLHDIIRCYDPKFVHQFDPEKSYPCGDLHFH